MPLIACGRDIDAAQDEDPDSKRARRAHGAYPRAVAIAMSKLELVSTGQWRGMRPTPDSNLAAWRTLHLHCDMPRFMKSEMRCPRPHTGSRPGLPHHTSTVASRVGPMVDQYQILTYAQADMLVLIECRVPDRDTVVQLVLS